MPFLPVGELLDQIRRFHRQLAHIYVRGSARQRDRRVAMLFTEFAWQEKRLEDGLAAFQREVADAIEKTWVQYAADEAVRRAFAEVDIDADMALEDVVERVHELDSSLKDLYRLLASSLKAERPRQMFQNLLDLEEGKSRRQAKCVAEILQRRNGRSNA